MPARAYLAEPPPDTWYSPCLDGLRRQLLPKGDRTLQRAENLIFPKAKTKLSRTHLGIVMNIIKAHRHNHAPFHALRCIAFALLLLPFLGGQGFAQTAGDVRVTLKAQKVLRTKDGREILQAAERAFPGEIIQYDALYQNQSKKGVHNLEPTLPIPAGLEYLPQSIAPAPAKASLDGRTFASIPLTRSVNMPDGGVKQEPVPYSEYRALRWEIGDLESGKTAAVSARARLVIK
jgi:hypothetical protein